MDLQEKKTFRKQMLAKRDALTQNQRVEADEKRTQAILSWDTYKTSDLILLYVSYRSEADTLQLLKEALCSGKAVAVPKVVGTDMVFYRITDITQLTEGYRGILEPDVHLTSPLSDVEINNAANGILFVPGCAFDKAGGRMGYGGGFYDRFIDTHPKLLRAALAFEEQLVPEVPKESHDKPVNLILTEDRFIQGGTEYGKNIWC